MTKHTPKTAIDAAGRQHLMHGEPMCPAPNAPGSTTSINAMVTCEACIALLERRN